MAASAGVNGVLLMVFSSLPGGRSVVGAGGWRVRRGLLSVSLITIIDRFNNPSCSSGRRPSALPQVVKLGAGIKLFP